MVQVVDVANNMVVRRAKSYMWMLIYRREKFLRETQITVVGNSKTQCAGKNFQFSIR